MSAKRCGGGTGANDDAGVNESFRMDAALRSAEDVFKMTTAAPFFQAAAVIVSITGTKACEASPSHTIAVPVI